MGKLTFKKGEFLQSSFEKETWPPARSCEIAIIGRSNVGKSSLINHLLQSKKMAKASATPGKTQLINFFLIDDKAHLIDLPGYGFAKVPQKLKRDWGVVIDSFLHARKEVSLFLVLQDIRRDFKEEEFELLSFANQLRKKVLIVFTKCDKLKKNEVAKRTKELLETLGESAPPHVHFSIKEKSARDALIRAMNGELWGN